MRPAYRHAWRRAAFALCAAMVGCGSDEGEPAPIERDASTFVDAAKWAAPDAGPPPVKPDLDYELPHDGGIRGETMCDGIDNDSDGIIDNVDFGNDGICDCLSIVSIGKSLHGGDETFGAWLDRRSGGVTELGSQELTAAALAPHKVLLIKDVRERAYSQAEIDVVTAWVEAGGGIFAMTGYTADFNQNVNALLAPYGVQFGLLLVLTNIFADESVPVDGWIADPVTEGISKVGVVSGYEVQGSGKILAQGNDSLQGKVTMLRSAERGKGKVLAWGDEWITYNSEWITRTDYQVARLWQNALRWLGGDRECKLPPIVI